MSALPKEKRPLAGEAHSNELVKASQSGGSGSKAIVAELRSLLGDDVVLLRIPRGSKKPVIKGWQSITLGRMQSPEYLATLDHDRNIGVLLGDGRITIDLDQDIAVEPFLNLNPKLRNTLTTRRIRGCNFWLRSKGIIQRPASLGPGAVKIGVSGARMVIKQ